MNLHPTEEEEEAVEDPPGVTNDKEEKKGMWFQSVRRTGEERKVPGDEENEFS